MTVHDKFIILDLHIVLLMEKLYHSEKYKQKWGKKSLRGTLNFWALENSKSVLRNTTFSYKGYSKKSLRKLAMQKVMCR